MPLSEALLLLKQALVPLDQIPTVIKTTASLITLLKWLASLRACSVAREHQIHALFGFLADADFTTGQVPRDDMDSLKLFKAWFQSYFGRSRTISFEQALNRADTRKHLCTIGGPVDHPFSRYAMGYSKSAEVWNPVLPFYFPLTEAALGPRITRRWKDVQWTSPNWFVSDREGKNRWIPETDEYHMLRSDYFLLSVLPNVFTSDAAAMGQKHLLLTPAHGLAQLAVKQVLDNDTILSELETRRRGSDYFQALIAVRGHKTSDGYAPTPTPKILDVQPVFFEDYARPLQRFENWYHSAG